MEASAYLPTSGPEATDENRTWMASREALNHQRDNLQRGLELNDSGERVNFSFLLDSLGQRPGNSNADLQHQQQHPSPTTGRATYPSVPACLPEQLQLPAAPWSFLPKNGPPTCPLDRLLLNFLHSRQRDPNNGDGVDGSVLSPPSYPSVLSLLNPSSNATLDPLSQLMTDIISKFPNISELPNQIAVLFAMFSLMRWQIHPTQGNYDRLPDWLRPTPAQIYTAHPAWLDHIPWPRMRDVLVANQQAYPFDNWFLSFTAGLSVNWPYDPVDCLLTTSEKDQPVMNPVFERHIRRIENWSLGPLFAETFPDLIETTRIKSPDHHAGATGVLRMGRRAS